MDVYYNREAETGAQTKKQNKTKKTKEKKGRWSNYHYNARGH